MLDVPEPQRWNGLDIEIKPVKSVKSVKPVPSALSVAALFAALALPATATVTIDWVSVGDVGNAADTTGYGAVSYDYQIGKYEVTIGQYTEFLNATAVTDTYGLYNSNMESNENIAGITQSGSSGSYSYSATGSADRPITYVGWFDAARMSNWMHNGQGSGSTETGAYTLNGATSGTGFAANAGASYRLPTENEWYKAAYYSGSGSTYYLYPTQSDAVPGNVVGGAANQANYYNGVFSVTQSGTYSSSQNYLTDVGAFTGSASHYGTFDQAGNVYEWNDAVIGGSSRGLGGGYWYGSLGEYYLRSSNRFSDDPGLETDVIGFRLAVPEPSAGLLALIAGGLGLMRRRRPTL